MLEFYAEEDRGDHYGVFEQSYAGSCFVRLYKDQIDLDKGYICDIPVTEKLSYKNPRIYFSGSNISVLHGSKRGIQASHGNRVSEYDYYFSYWLGKRFAKYVKRTSKKILSINTSKEAPCNHRSYQDICDYEFQRGFDDVFDSYNLTAKIIQKSIVDCNYKGRDAYLDKAVIFSDLYLCCFNKDMDSDILSETSTIMNDMAEIDMLEKQKDLN